MEAGFKIDTVELEDSIVKRLLAEFEPLRDMKGFHDDKILSVATLAKYLEVSEQWVRDRVKFKEIPYMKIGKKLVKFKKSDIDSDLPHLVGPPLE